MFLLKYALHLFMQEFKIIHFTFAGLQLQEPSTFISDIILAICCFILGFKTHKLNNVDNSYFFKFFLFLGVSTLFGAFGHILFFYGGNTGKFPSWIFASISTFFFCNAIIEDKPAFFNSKWKSFVWIKAVVILFLSLIYSKFIFVAIDSIFSYLLFGGVLSYSLWNDNRLHMKYIVYGTIVLIPSAFVFILDVNLHTLFNRDDLSHLIIMMTILLYYKAILDRNRLIPNVV
jgi:hypothetical protein